MTKEELEQLKELAKKYERGKDKDTVLKVISEDMHEVFQEINDGGHSAATKAAEKKLKGLEDQVEPLKKRAETAEAKLEAFDNQAPDVAKVRKTYEENEQKLRNEHAARMQQVQTEHEQALQKKDQELTQSRLSIAKKTLVDKLVSVGKVDKDYAETILVNRPDVTERLNPDPATGNVRVLKKGSKDMFIVPAEGRTDIDHLVDELAEGVEAKWKTSGAGRGSGTRGSEGGSGATNGSLDQRFQARRDRAKAIEKGARDAKAGGSGAERLGRGRRG